jgi:ABC-type lipoprotein export system ATPase subunit
MDTSVSPHAQEPRRQDIDPLVRLRKIEKSFDHGAGRFHVLRRIDLDVRPGEFVSVMGPSGAGKSTLLHLLGLRNETIGFVFQSYHLLDELTVAENLDVPLSYRDVKRSERQSLVAETLDRFGLAARAKLYPRQLSGGQQQLVGIARALVAKPRLLLADEPTGNLHSEQAREIMQLFRDLNGAGMTIVQVTHSEENARQGTRVVRLRDGWIESDGPGQ